jgi:AbrB family transcriptional regulator (stage V sporulation protein T)
MEERKVKIHQESLNLTANEDDKYNAAVIAPIIANGDVIGSVILTTKETAEMGRLEQKMCETAAGFLARQIGN